ncbi:uncharacterized protein LOC144444783 [Glandiceps talaboti]
MAYLTSCSEIPSLLKAMEKWPSSSLPICRLLKSSYRSNNVWPHISIYTDNKHVGNVTSVVCCLGHFRNQAGKSYSCHSTNYEKLKSLLVDPDVVDWSSDPVLFVMTALSHINIIEESCRLHFKVNKGVQTTRHVYVLGDKCKEATLKISKMQLPSGYSCAPVQEKHAGLMKEHGVEYRRSVSDISSIIKHSHSLGIYKNGDIVSWSSVKEFDDIGMTNTLREHQRMGFASILTAKLAVKIMEMGETPYVLISTDNEVSKKMHGRLDFTKTVDSDAAVTTVNFSDPYH